MIINLKSQTELSGFYIVYEGSTNLEKPGWYGISHLEEHLMCKNFEHLRGDFEREGIDWNAYTSSNEIVFYFMGLDEYLNKRKYEIIELMQQFNVSKEQFENERKIVLQELGNYFADQSESHMLNLQRKILNHYDAIGLREDIEKLKFMDCLNFFDLQYKNPSKIINVSKRNKFVEDVEFSDNRIDKKTKFGIYDDVVLEKMNNYGDKVSFIMASPVMDGDNNYINFINSMLSMGLDSPLYDEVREKRGLVYYIRLGQSRYNQDGITYLTTQTTEKNLDKLEDTIRFVFKTPEKFLTKKRFDIVKGAYTIKYKKEKINRYENVTKWINPVGWSVSEILETLTYDKIMEIYDKYYDFDKFHISNDKDEFKTK